MIICSCNNLNTKAVQEAINNGKLKPSEVQAYHNCKFDCANCAVAIRDCVNVICSDGGEG